MGKNDGAAKVNIAKVLEGIDCFVQFGSKSNEILVN